MPGKSTLVHCLFGSLTPAKSVGAANSNSTTSLLKACNTVGVKTQFMTNVWGVDEPVIKASGKNGKGTGIIL